MKKENMTINLIPHNYTVVKDHSTGKWVPYKQAQKFELTAKISKNKIPFSKNGRR